MKKTQDILIGGIVVLAIAGYGVFSLIEAQQERFSELQTQLEMVSVQQEMDAQTIELQEAEMERIQEENEQAMVEQNERIAEAEAETKRVSQQKVTSNSISVAELQSFMSAIVRVDCKNGWGSGSILHLSSLNETFVLTNRHVISGESSCYFYSGGKYYYLDLNDTLEWNSKSDASIVTISTANYGFNRKAGVVQTCSNKMPIGTPVVIIGFPSFAKGTQTVTDGIISGYSPANGLPYTNYYISAKMDSGNSGGLAISKDSTGLCNLGLPTWVSTGNFDNQGVVQNIQNVLHK